MGCLGWIGSVVAALGTVVLMGLIVTSVLVPDWQHCSYKGQNTEVDVRLGLLRYRTSTTGAQTASRSEWWESNIPVNENYRTSGIITAGLLTIPFVLGFIVLLFLGSYICVLARKSIREASMLVGYILFGLMGSMIIAICVAWLLLIPGNDPVTVRIDSSGNSIACVPGKTGGWMFGILLAAGVLAAIVAALFAGIPLLFKGIDKIMGRSRSRFDLDTTSTTQRAPRPTPMESDEVKDIKARHAQRKREQELRDLAASI